MKYTLKESKTYCANELIAVFNGLFEASHRTVLLGGAQEPEYIPSLHADGFSCIHFVGVSFASALHEVSHWLMAGSERRKMIDYGYWYEPDGRDPQTQKKFEAVEANNQSLEWILASACQMKFYISLDNLNGSPANVEDFREQVRSKALSRVRGTSNSRALLLIDTLIQRYSAPDIFEDFWDRVDSEHLLPEF